MGTPDLAAGAALSPAHPHAEPLLDIVDEELGTTTLMSENQAIEHIRHLECLHQGNIAAIDKFHEELRHYTMMLAQDQKEDDDAQAHADQEWVEVEKAKAEQEWIMQALQNELKALEERKGHNALVEEEVIQMAERTLAQGGELGDDDELIDVLEARETELRRLEDRLVWVEDMLEDRRAEVKQLDEEHAALARSGAHYFTQTEQILKDLQQGIEERTVEHRNLLQRKAHLEGEQRTFTEARDRALVYHDECAALQRKLELDLTHVSSERDEAAAVLQETLVEVFGERGSDEMLRKLDEVMMGLKAYAVNLHHDHTFVEEVFRAMGDPQQALVGYHIAFQYVEEYVVAAYGEQVAGERWRLDHTHETRYDEVEALLSSLKQLVICYDAMQTAQKRQIEVAFEVVHNAAHLNRLAHDTSVKFAEMLEARERQKERDVQAREQRVKQTLARHREQSAKKRAAMDMPPAERAALAARGASDTPRLAHHSQGKRDPSPKLAPRRS